MKNNPLIKTYLQTFHPKIKSRLHAIYLLIKSQFPDALETFSYQMPTFKNKKNLIHFAGYANHIGIYPGPQGILYLQSIMPSAITSKGAWKIDHSDPIPENELIKLCQWIKENS